MKLLSLLFLLLSFVFSDVKVEQALLEEAKSANFTPHSSTVLGIMGSSPASINTFGSFRDFKVDWIYAGGTFPKNIAFETDLIWMLFFRWAPYKVYEASPLLVKKLSDISFSFGHNLQGTNGQLGAALRFNLLKGWDPLTDKVLLAKFKTDVSPAEVSLFKRMIVESDPAEVKKLEREIVAIEKAEFDRAKTLFEEIKSTNWNASSLNVGYANILRYVAPSGDYDTFRYVDDINVVWVDGGIKVGNHMLASFLSRWYISQSLFSAANFRFGKDYNKLFFVEYAMSFDFKEITEHQISFGANFDIAKKLFLNLGLRSYFLGKDFTFVRIQPIINISLKI